MTLGYDRQLYMLAFDHRASFSENLLGIAGVPAGGDLERVAATKMVIYEGFERAVAGGVAPETAGLLVDEQFGSAVARRAHAAGRTLAMPAEKSGQNEFDFEYGEDFGGHIEDFDPTFAKVLVRYNPGGDQALNKRQAVRLRRLSDWLHERDRKFLFELLVPAEQQQLAAVGGAQERYDAEIRPGLVVQTMQEMQAGGVEPDIWKIEGFEHRNDCIQAVAQARTGGRDGAVCIVLGRGADGPKVLRWLKEAAGVPGYSGFAVGRTLWWDELARYVAGEIDGPEASARIATNYVALIDAYEGFSAGR